MAWVRFASPRRLSVFKGEDLAKAAQPDIWRNRITGYADVPPDQLLANESNFRRHPRNQQDALTGLIGEIGYIDPVLVQLGTDRVIDGHLRVELAMRSGQATIPVQYVDLTDEEANLALASFDPISALAFHDQEQLDALLASVSTDDANVQALLDSLTAPDFDANAEWQGMPEFQQEDQMPVKQVVVSFASESAVKAFAQLVEQDVTMTTKSVWFPAAQRVRNIDLGWTAEEETDAA